MGGAGIMIKWPAIVILGIICVVLLILTVTQREDIRSLEDRIAALESGLTATAAEHESSITESSVIAGDSQANQSSSGTKATTSTSPDSSYGGFAGSYPSIQDLMSKINQLETIVTDFGEKITAEYGPLIEELESNVADLADQIPSEYASRIEELETSVSDLKVNVYGTEDVNIPGDNDLPESTTVPDVPDIPSVPPGGSFF
jgi:polyhydroxyalkanoate synthesis regulator phasin